KVRGALVYPAFTMGVAVLVGIVLILYTLPALVGLLSEFGGELPITTRLLISFSELSKGNTTYILAVILGLPAALIVYTRTSGGARVRDRVVLKLPVIGTVTERMNLFGFTATMSSLLDSGIPIMEALQLSQQSVTNIVYRERLERVTEETSQGVRLGVAFSHHWPSPPVLSSGITTGETSGTLVPALRALAEYFEQEATRAAAAATELIQPAIMVLVAGAVGFVAIAVISGVYSTVGAVK
ncbi:MAG: type II secretion system F family protein, partial [Actinomycetota bacterium]